jgi:hypothetical protein
MALLPPAPATTAIAACPYRRPFSVVSVRALFILGLAYRWMRPPIYNHLSTKK